MRFCGIRSQSYRLIIQSSDDLAFPIKVRAGKRKARLSELSRRAGDWQKVLSSRGKSG
jgi:hypothetical protein